MALLALVLILTLTLIFALVLLLILALIFILVIHGWFLLNWKNLVQSFCGSPQR